MNEFLQLWRRWAVDVWPHYGQRLAVAAQYAALKQSPLMLADLCKRNHVFGPAPDVDNLFAAGIAEGKRRAVLEVLLLSRVDPQAIAAVPRQRGEGDRHAA